MQRRSSARVAGRARGRASLKVAALIGGVLAASFGCASILGIDHEYVDRGEGGGGGEGGSIKSGSASSVSASTGTDSSTVSSAVSSTVSATVGAGGAGGSSVVVGAGGAGGGPLGVCGDGQIEPGEDCDDKNQSPGDGCSPTCKKELSSSVCPGPDVPISPGNDIVITDTTVGAGQDLDSDCGGTNAPDRVYAVMPSATGTLTIKVDPNFQSNVSVRTSCPLGPAPSELTCGQSQGGQGPVTLQIWVEAGKTYYVVVDGNLGSAGMYTLNLDLTRCGDSIKQGLEQCDDGDADLTDGCAGCLACNGINEVENSTTHHCYLVGTNSLSWTEARSKCVVWGGDLAALSSANEFNNTISLCTNDLWTGGNDLAQEGTFVNSNGEPWYNGWYPGQPDMGVSANCVRVACNQGGFADTACGNSFNYLCERAPAP